MSNLSFVGTDAERHSIVEVLRAAALPFRALIEGIAEARHLHDDYLKLSTLTEPELQDMGIRRSDIHAVVAGSYPLPSRRGLSLLAGKQEHGSPFLQDTCSSRPKEKIMCEISEETSVNEVDVHSLVPAMRHQKIFQLVAELIAGESFILVNDHDPKPLYYQLEAEYPGQFSWTYLEKGPAAWRVEIGRLQKAA